MKKIHTVTQAEDAAKVTALVTKPTGIWLEGSRLCATVPKTKAGQGISP